jgi:hypothetical protein
MIQEFRFEERDRKSKERIVSEMMRHRGRFGMILESLIKHNSFKANIAHAIVYTLELGGGRRFLVDNNEKKYVSFSSYERMFL